jgi:formate hydrogenlyase subunit 4
MFHVVAGLKSKYATLAAARVLLVGVLVEVLFALSFLLLYAHAGGYGLEELADAGQAN